MSMNEITLAFGFTYGALAVIFGAFGAHALKKTLSEEQLKSFETGVKYQIYHAIVLVLLGSSFDLSNPIENKSALCFIVGVFLFSFSIYGLVLSSARGKKIKILGPITPLGGLLLVIGWVLMAFSVISHS